MKFVLDVFICCYLLHNVILNRGNLDIVKLIHALKIQTYKELQNQQARQHVDVFVQEHIQPMHIGNKEKK